MRLFRRKQDDEDEGERCPYCGERVPEGAADCMMCGAALEPVRVERRDEETEARSA